METLLLSSGGKWQCCLIDHEKTSIPQLLKQCVMDGLLNQDYAVWCNRSNFGNQGGGSSFYSDNPTLGAATQGFFHGIDQPTTAILEFCEPIRLSLAFCLGASPFRWV